MLEIILALLVVFLLYSSIVSGIVEWINNSSFRQKREMYLFMSIRQALNDPQSISWGSLVYRHPQITSLKNSKRRYPAYIAASTFADALLGILKDYDLRKRLRYSINEDRFRTISVTDDNGYEYFKRVINSLENGKFKRLLMSFLVVESSKDDQRMSLFRNNIEEWYDNYQDQLVAGYKKSIKRDLFWFGWALAILLNINFLSILDAVVHDSDLRTSLVGTAEGLAQNYPFSNSIECEGCSEEEFTKKYDAYINEQITRLDSASTWFHNSGLPILWELPLTTSQRRVEYLRNKAKRLELIKEDTLNAITGRYCLMSNFFQGNQDSIHQANISLLKLEPDSVSNSELVKVSKKYGLTYKESDTKNILFAWEAISDSVSISECLPKSMRTPYKECLADCSCTDRILLQHDVLKQLDDRIRNYTLEMEIYQSQVSYWDKATSYLGVFAYNLRDLGDWFNFLVGTIIMALIGAEGSSTWFQLLLRFVDIRFAGVKPKPKTSYKSS
ncbi:MAG: hypothetical protein AAF620_17580 [Bacteroidota bacterium]